MSTDIFNLTADAILKDESKKEGNLYLPKLKDGKYSAVIRFLPNIFDVEKSIISKWVIWLTDPNTDEKRYVDCPSTVGDPSILQDTFFALRNSDNVALNKLTPAFSRREIFYSNVMILKDPQNPELEGKIKIFKYGRKIYDKIKLAMSPEDGLTEPNQPFDLFEGKPFILKMKLVNNFNNYDDSIFADKPQPLIIPEVDSNGNILKDDAGKLRCEVMSKKEKNIPIIKKFLNDNISNLEEYEYKAWDEDVKNFVVKVIQASLPAGPILNKLFNKFKISGVESTATNVTTTQKTSNKQSNSQYKIDLDESNQNVDIDESDDIIDEIDDIISSTASKTKTSQKKTTSNIDIDDFDDDDDDLDSALEDL